MKEILGRLLSPTPKFFKKLMRIGLAIGAIGGVLMEEHIAELLPPFFQTVAGYMVTIGVCTFTISNLPVDGTPPTPPQNTIQKSKTKSPFL